MNFQKKEVKIIPNQQNEVNINKLIKPIFQSKIIRELLYQMKNSISKNNNVIKREILLPMLKSLSDIFLPYIIFTYSLIFLNLIIAIIILFIILTKKN
jgi:dTDP-4-amino-4,6-dideoxygalactose transaminase